MRKTREEAEVTRQNLLKAALTVFSRNGYAATRLEDIAEEAGVTRGAIYHHFGGKAELYNTLALFYTARASRIGQAVMAEGGPVLERFRRVFILQMALVEEDEEFRAVTELITLKTAVVPELDEGMRMKVDGWRQQVAATTQVLADAIRSGEVRPDVDPTDAALAYLGLQSGLVIQWLVDPQTFSLKARAAAIIDLFIRGIAAR